MRLAGKLFLFLPCTFAMFAQTPAITSVNPNTGQQGINDLNVAIEGQFTHWVQGSTHVWREQCSTMNCGPRRCELTSCQLSLSIQQIAPNNN
jgi:hypothetical protein